MSSSTNDVGFIPGGASLKYSSPLTVTFKIDYEASAMVDEWCRRTGKSLKDLQMADYAFIVDKTINGLYHVDFVKCRNREAVISWCQLQWGEPGEEGAWLLAPGKGYYNPRIIVRDDNAMVLLKMVWE